MVQCGLRLVAIAEELNRGGRTSEDQQMETDSLEEDDDDEEEEEEVAFSFNGTDARIH